MLRRTQYHRGGTKYLKYITGEELINRRCLLLHRDGVIWKYTCHLGAKSGALDSLNFCCLSEWVLKVKVKEVSEVIKQGNYVDCSPVKCYPRQPTAASVHIGDGAMQPAFQIRTLASIRGMTCEILFCFCYILKLYQMLTVCQALC